MYMLLLSLMNKCQQPTVQSLVGAEEEQAKGSPYETTVYCHSTACSLWRCPLSTLISLMVTMSRDMSSATVSLGYVYHGLSTSSM